MTVLTLSLPESLTIGQAHAFHDELEQKLHDTAVDEIELKAAGVKRADTAGLQLVLALVRYAKEHNLPLRWTQPSEAIVSAASTLGISVMLEL